MQPPFDAVQAVLYGILPALLWGVFGAWCHHKLTQRTSSPLLAAYQNLKQGATTSSLGDLDTPDKLKKFFRFKDVSQVALFCRVMRKWDPDGAPDEDAVALGEFILKVGVNSLPLPCTGVSPTCQYTLRFYLLLRGGSATRPWLVVSSIG